jgi:hypothetical protein
MIRTYGANSKAVTSAEVIADITYAADGSTERKVLAKYESFSLKLRKLGRKILPWFAMALMAGAAGAATRPEQVAELVQRHDHALLPISQALVGGAALGATLIVNGGKALTANRVLGSGTEPKYVAWGTGAGTAGATDTSLFTESTEEARTNGTSSRVTTTVTNDTYQVVGTITVATSNKTITNVGLFDAVTTGNLWFKSDFTGLALLIGDAIQFTIRVAFA